MKKFGTPTGAGPGKANEKVGLAADGTPPPVRGAGGFGACGVAFGLPLLLLLLLRLPRLPRLPPCRDRPPPPVLLLPPGLERPPGCWRLGGCWVTREGGVGVLCVELLELEDDEALVVVVVVVGADWQDWL